MVRDIVPVRATFILLDSMFLMWSLRYGGTPRAFIPVRSFLFASLRPVACCILFLASSSFSCHRMGGAFFIYHFRISLYAWWASDACSLAPSLRLFSHSLSSVVIWSSLSLPLFARVSALKAPCSIAARTTYSTIYPITAGFDKSVMP